MYVQFTGKTAIFDFSCFSFFSIFFSIFSFLSSLSFLWRFLLLPDYEQQLLAVFVADVTVAEDCIFSSTATEHDICAH